MAITGKTQNIHAEVIKRLQRISDKLGTDIEISSGYREQNGKRSAHHFGIAVDIKIAGLESVAIADELVSAGFKGVGEYWTEDGSSQRRIAHGDLRGLVDNCGVYGIGGEKSAPIAWTGYGGDGNSEPSRYDYKGRKSGRPGPQ